MKKYFLGMAAVVLALSLSAFTTPKMSDYVYFEVDGSGQIIDDEGGVQEDEAFGCSTDPGELCAKGYLATDNTKVQQVNGEWHLINPSAIADAQLTRP